MDKRNKVARFCLVSNIMQGISLFFIVGLLVLSLVLAFSLSGYIAESAGMMENVNPDDVTAGWQVLFGAAGSFFGIVAWILLIGVAILFIGPMIAESVALIYGIRTYKKRDTVDFKRMVKNDSIIKLVIHAVIVIVGLYSIPTFGSVKSFVAQLGEMVLVLVLCAPSITSVIMSIMALCNIKHIEELPDVSHAQYIEYDEDNSPYFGQ